MSQSVSFFFRERKKGDPLWYARAKVGDAWKSFNTGATTEKAARAWWRRQVLSGRLQSDQHPTPTLDEWADGFFGRGGRFDKAKQARGHLLSQTYLENLGRHYKKYLSPVFGSRKIDSIPALDIENLLLSLYSDGEGLAGSTVNGILISARALFGEAYRLEIIDRNPTTRVKQFAKNGRERGALTAAETDALFGADALTTVWGGDRQNMLISMLSFGCGLRQGEALALRPSDFGDGILSVSRAWDRVAREFKPPKWGSVRTVPVPQGLAAEVADYAAVTGIDDDALLFPGTTGQPVEPHRVLAALRSALAAIGISRSDQERDKRFLDLHALRHTYVTRLTAGNIPLWEVQAAVGHKSVAVTQRYTHVGGSDLAGVRTANILPFKKRSA